MTRAEILEKIKPSEGKYKKINAETKEEYIDYKEMEEDKKTRWEIALEDGQDPFNILSLEEVFNDWQFIFKFRIKYNK
jgi:hypothetical protein